MAPSVLIVDDHDVFRSACRVFLEAEGFRVVGEAATGVQAVHEAARLLPDLVLLDIQLPDLDGFAIADLLGALAKPPLVVFVSTRDAATYGRLPRDTGS
ncbi:LytR/AlgR family response regulator transcription factor [Nonomuraea africana]|uniref:DNA-binding NarL/FixJ family response regulator n=1 Tax=Nonomuraea africana TaxID=46171 RepID=A0ABR9KPM9_9ACTN|nr:response regulator [Nonomuraea africana]MBE1563991.1 DNA-binding NarL/FixJ family response regulator [Nonomuraea africana]